MTGRRSRWAAIPPRGLRPKLSADQLRDLSMAHHSNLDAMAKGEADSTILWQWVGGCLTWSRVAQALRAGEPEMVLQLGLVDAVVDRFVRTGRVGFSGPEYQLAKDGVIVMDLLASEVDAYSAGLAADWSELEIGRRAKAVTRTGVPA